MIEEGEEQEIEVTVEEGSPDTGNYIKEHRKTTRVRYKIGKEPPVYVMSQE